MGPYIDPYIDLAETTRSGFVECLHRGAVVALDRDGSIAFAAGDPSVAVYPRSSTKPLQALAMVQAGLVLPSDLLALVCSSHGGTPRHLDGVRRILAGAGLAEAALGNTPDLPLDSEASREVLRSGGDRTALQHTCSGKHAGMLATCEVNGWPLDWYLDKEHPLQLAITASLPHVTEEAVNHIGVDGCGSPAHVMSLGGLARAFRNIAVGAAGDSGRQVAAAMTAHPLLLGGTGRDITVLIQLVPGIVAKDGFEGVYAAALPDGRAVAIKIADGASRARPPVLIAALRALGVDVSAVEPLVRQTILGHGHEVGEVRITAAFRAVLPSA
jgi:L-asparaginase II